MRCPWCAHEAVRRPQMEHATQARVKPNGTPAQPDVHVPRKGWFCPSCKRVFKGNA